MVGDSFPKILKKEIIELAILCDRQCKTSPHRITSADLKRIQAILRCGRSCNPEMELEQAREAKNYRYRLKKRQRNVV